MTHRLQRSLLTVASLLLFAPAAFAQTTMQRAGNPSFTSVTQMSANLVMAISFQDMAKAKAGNFTLITYYSGGSVSATTTRDSRSLSALNTNPAKVTRPAPAPGTYTATALINDADGKTFWEATKSFTIEGAPQGGTPPAPTSSTATMSLGTVAAKDGTLTIPVTASNLATGDVVNVSYVNTKTNAKSSVKTLKASDLSSGSGTLTWTGAPKDTSYDVTATLVDAARKELNRVSGKVTLDAAGNSTAVGTDPPPGGGTTDPTNPADPSDPADDPKGGTTGGEGDTGGTNAQPALPINQILISKNPLNNSGQVEASGLSAIIRRITTSKGLVGILLAFVLSFLGIVALMILVISGFRYITAFGGDTAGAKKAIGNVIIGIIVILGAWAIVTTVINFGAGPAI